MKRSEITDEPQRTATVRSFGDGCVTDDEGWSIGCDTDGRDFPEGARVEYWGKGIGFPVRGLAIDGHVFWYRTEAEEEARRVEETRATKEKRKAEFERDRAKHDARYEALPETFRARVDRFRQANTAFRWEFEPYEVMCCTDAVRIASWCSINRIATEFEGDEPTAAENVLAFQRLPWEEQKKAGIDEGHSGNSFGFACRLAYLWVTDPGLVEREHGALTPLVGCETYGCEHEQVAS